MRANKKLRLEQLEQKLNAFKKASDTAIPTTGWIKNIRTSLNMTLQQLGHRLGMTRQGIRMLEEREANGSISINTLKEVGNALDMRLVYGFVPLDGSIDKLIERKAKALATTIVMRTDHNMKLEDQGTGKVKNAIEELAEEIKREMNKSLWD